MGKLGCFLCIIGSTIIVIHSPKEAEISDLELLIDKARDTTFVVYVLVVIGISAFIAFYLGPKAGHKNVLIYIILCSAIGSLTVMSCKALGLAIKDQISGRHNDFGMSLPYILLLVSAVFIAVQMNYLNKALDIFSTSIVTPIYYVIFTTLVITASAILFKEWKHMKPQDVVGDLCGFLVVIIAVIMLNAFRDMDVSMDDVRGQMRPKRKLISMNGGSTRGSTITHPAEESLMTRQNYGGTSSSDSDRNV